MYILLYVYLFIFINGEVKIMNKRILKSVKKIADKEIKNTIDGKCLFLCYQPKIPVSLQKKVKY